MKMKRIKYIATIVIGAMISCMVPQQLQAKEPEETTEVNVSLKEQEMINEGARELVIKSAREMNEFAVKVNNSDDGYRGRVVKLGKDIEYTGIDNYTPINKFRGTFDGCGYTIKGIQVVGTENNIGLFASTSGAVIQNVTIEDCSFIAATSDAGWYAGGIVGYASDTYIKNCHNVNTIVDNAMKGIDTGGIVGYGYDSTVLNCSSSGKVVGAGQVGGIAGHISEVYNSYNTGQVECASTSYSTIDDSGGIAGRVGIIMNCYNTGKITGGIDDEVGGIAGTVWKKAIGNYCAEEAAERNFYEMSGIEEGNEAMPLEEMKTDSFVQKLNANLGSTHEDWLEWQRGNESSFPQHIPLISMKKVAVILSDTEFTYNGQKRCPKVKVALGEEVLMEGRDYEIAYKNCKEPGKAIVTVTGLGRYIDNVEVEYTIVPLDLTTAKITLSQSSYYYDGNAKTPEVTVSVDGVVVGKWKSGCDYLDEEYCEYDEDWEIYIPRLSMQFKNNLYPGTATVTIKGNGTHYTGTVSKTFKILKENQIITISGSYSKTDKDAPFYISAYVSKGDGVLSYKSSDNSVISMNSSTGYATIKGPGRAVITITAKATTGYNEKQAQVVVDVKPKKQSATVKIGKNRTMTVKWEKDKKVTGYILQYGTDKSFKKNTKEVVFKKNKSVSKKISKLKKGKTYYVRVRSYKTMKANGKVVTLNGAWSTKVKTGKIK